MKNYFVDKVSGWGMNFEGGYFVIFNFGFGFFMNYSSNYEYFLCVIFFVGEGIVNID